MEKTKVKQVPQTYAEEVASAITHGLGAMLSIAALVVMVVYSARYGDAWKVVSASIFGASMIFLYSASTLYHATKDRVKDICQKIDHSAIYVLIAGTYTPFTLVSMRGAWGWSIFGVIWGLALAGVMFQVFFYREKYRSFSAILYLLMGWIVIIAIKPMINGIPFGGLMWLFGGGLFYSVGVVFYISKKLPFSHGIWHLFVLGGSVCHFFSIYLYVL